jgi:hypothetical protein
VAGCCECGDEPSGSCATELVSFNMENVEASSVGRKLTNPVLLYVFCSLCNEAFSVTQII